MLVEPPRGFADRVDDDQSAAGQLDRIRGAAERIEQEARTEALVAQATGERKPSKQDRWDALWSTVAELRWQLVATDLMGQRLKYPMTMFPSTHT